MVDATLIWRKTVKRILTTVLGYLEALFDPCFLYLHIQNEKGVTILAGIVLVDVDDFLDGGNEEHQQRMVILREHIQLGKQRKRKGDFLGRHLKQSDDFATIEIDMERYISEELKIIPITSERAKNLEAKCTEAVISRVRGVGGSMTWLVREVRLDLGAGAGQLTS